MRAKLVFSAMAKLGLTSTVIAVSASVINDAAVQSMGAWAHIAAGGGAVLSMLSTLVYVNKSDSYGRILGRALNALIILLIILALARYDLLAVFK